MKSILSYITNENRLHRNVVIFMSGSGTNAQRILEYWRENKKESNYNVILFTDRPNESRARSVAKQFNLKLIENDIRLFYKKRGCKRVTLASEDGRRLREEWTTSVRDQLKPFHFDFGLFAGFIPLTNIASDFPCLNVHPGDLTYTKNGRRYLVGLHTIPIEKAILEGLSYLRSSVIVAQPYNNHQSNIDSGPVLGISEKIGVDLQEYPLSELMKIADLRLPARPVKGYQDDLERVAKFNQEKLKHKGDWVVFPQVVQGFADGKFGRDQDRNLYYKRDDDWIKVQTIVFGKSKKEFIR